MTFIKVNYHTKKLKTRNRWKGNRRYFEFHGVMLAVCEDGDIRCDGCYLYRGMHEKLCRNTNDRIGVGTCNVWKRKDRKNVVLN